MSENEVLSKQHKTTHYQIKSNSLLQYRQNNGKQSPWLKV